MSALRMKAVVDPVRRSSPGVGSSGYPPPIRNATRAGEVSGTLSMTRGWPRNSDIWSMAMASGSNEKTSGSGPTVAEAISDLATVLDLG